MSRQTKQPRNVVSSEEAVAETPAVVEPETAPAPETPAAEEQPTELTETQPVAGEAPPPAPPAPITVVCNDPRLLTLPNGKTYQSLFGRQTITDPELIPHLRKICEEGRSAIFLAE